MNVTWSKIKQLHWTDSEFDRTYFLYINTVIGTLAVDGWAVTFGTARRGLGVLRPRPSLLYKM